MPHRGPRLAIAGLSLTLALAACSGTGASPSASVAPASVAPSTAPSSSAPSSEPSEAPSASVEASVAPSASSAASSSPAASSGADVTITAIDFSYEGVPATVASGTTFGLVNAGQEVHEMIVVRKLPTTTESFEELLALPPEQSQALVEDVGFAFAEPGQTAADVVTIGEPGDYLMVCFIPAGTTSLPSIDPNASAPPSLGTGAPHATLGMVKEFTVTE